jgi:hypothetical protein
VKSWAKVFIGVVLVGAIIVAGLVGLGVYRYRMVRQNGTTMPGMAFFAQRRQGVATPQAPVNPNQRAVTPRITVPNSRFGMMTPGLPRTGIATMPGMMSGNRLALSRMASIRTRAPFMMLGMLFVAWLALSFGAAAFWAVSKVFLGERTNMVWHTVRQAPLRSLGYGILTCIALCLAAVALAITIIGIPLAMLAGAIGVLLAVIGYAGIAKGVGMSIMKSDDRPEIVQALLGGLVLSVLIFIPVVGWLTIAMLIHTGVGALASVLWPEIAGGKKSGPAPEAPVVA